VSGVDFVKNRRDLYPYLQKALKALGAVAPDVDLDDPAENEKVRAYNCQLVAAGLMLMHMILCCDGCMEGAPKEIAATIKDLGRSYPDQERYRAQMVQLLRATVQVLDG
jgi:hypothetical protein